MPNSTKLTPKPADIDPKPDPSKISATATSKNLQGLAIGLGIIALIAAFYAIYVSKQSHERNAQYSNSLNFAVKQLKQQQSDIQSDLDTAKIKFNQTQLNLQNQLQAMNKTLQSSLQQGLYQKQDWLLLKARYYLELAQINAHWSSDQETTIALLEQADELLHAIPDQQLFAIRQAIANEIVQLQALPKIDIAGLLSQLDAAENAINNLPIKKPFSNIKTNATSSKSSSAWRQKLQESMNALEKLVIVRRHEADIQPMLSPLHQTLLRDSIRFNIQEAQWALLQNNPKIYQLSLAQALRNVNRAFDENAPATQALIKQLQSLKQEKLETARPTVNQSLLLLNQFIESRSATIKEGEKT